MNKTNIILQSEINTHSSSLGPKTRNLQQCVELGFSVPRFVALPATISNRLLADAVFRSGIIDEIVRVLPGERYAVRSSALIEDDEQHSQAGQFLTKTDVSHESLDQALCDVITHANTYLNGVLEEFSVIVQEYIASDIAGVLFTRNPMGDRHAMIEYNDGAGEQIVGGHITPKRMAFFWHTIPSEPAELSALFHELLKLRNLETHFQFPQDIEWCVRGQTVYILQTRSITSISNSQYAGIKLLDDALPTNCYFAYEQTEISEIAPRPTPITFDILEQIYSNDGPIQRVYQRLHVRYRYTDFLKIIGNQLFVERGLERRSVPTTLRNTVFLNLLSIKLPQQWLDALHKALTQHMDSTATIQEIIDDFLQAYETIFAVNLRSGIAVRRVETFLSKQPVSLVQLANFSECLPDPKLYTLIPPTKLQGNSLEISDMSPLCATHPQAQPLTAEVETWWKELTPSRRAFLQTQITRATTWLRLREYGRWLTVRHIHRLRSTLLELAHRTTFRNADNIYFASLTDIVRQSVSETTCQTTRQHYEAYSQCDLPQRVISSLEPIIGHTPLGVSAGVVKGRLVHISTMLEYSQEPVIVYTQMLTPNLTQYFGRIQGIVSQYGGMLSHLAILAREYGIPVVVNFQINDNIKLGDSIQINGSTGEIVKK